MISSDSLSQDDTNLEAEFACLVSGLVALRQVEQQEAFGKGFRFLVERILSFKIEIRPREGGHNHPHFHVTSPDYEGSYRIDNQQCIAGNVPRNYEKHIQDWANKNKTLLEESWKRAHPVSFKEKRTVIE